MGIGTLSEKCLHATLKRYCEPNEALHEQTVGRYIADILRGDEIIEIQTRNFHSMKPKLDFFLSSHRVTIVHPISYRKNLIWIDPATGESQKPRKSNKVGVKQELFYELIFLKDYLTLPNLCFRVIMVDVDEYRTLDGWSRDGKRGSHRAERIPLGVEDDWIFASKQDWLRMIPDDLGEAFTRAEFAKACRISKVCAERSIICLQKLGVISRCGKKSRSYLYKREID